jgi:elongator complex protein 2
VDGTDAVEKSACEDYCLPKAVHQLAWRPVMRDGSGRPYELAVAGEDSSLRVYGFSQAYLQVPADSQ